MITKNEIQKALAMNIGKSLADVRKRIGWTQGELAERIGVETETISRFERGATTPSLLTLQRLASVLNTTMAELLGESSPMPNDQARTISAWINDLETDDRAFMLEMIKRLDNRGNRLDYHKNINGRFKRSARYELL